MFHYSSLFVGQSWIIFHMSSGSKFQRTSLQLILSSFVGCEKNWNGCPPWWKKSAIPACKGKHRQAGAKRQLSRQWSTMNQHSFTVRTLDQRWFSGTVATDILALGYLSEWTILSFVKLVVHCLNTLSSHLEQLRGPIWIFLQSKWYPTHF